MISSNHIFLKKTYYYVILCPYMLSCSQSMNSNARPRWSGRTDAHPSYYFANLPSPFPFLDPPPSTHARVATPLPHRPCFHPPAALLHPAQIDHPCPSLISILPHSMRSSPLVPPSAHPSVLLYPRRRRGGAQVEVEELRWQQLAGAAGRMRSSCRQRPWRKRGHEGPQVEDDTAELEACMLQVYVSSVLYV